MLGGDDGVTEKSVDLHLSPQFRNKNAASNNNSSSSSSSNSSNNSNSSSGVEEDFIVPDAVRQHTRGLYSIISTLTTHVLPFISLDSVVFYYMPTLRADATVCTRSSKDGRIYVNVLVLQQQQGCEQASCEPKRLRRVWRYWTQRLAMADNGDVSAVPLSARAAADSTTNSGGGGRVRPTGLYDADVRRRFNALAQRLQLA